MGFVIVVGVVVGVYFLWRMMRAQESQARAVAVHVAIDAAVRMAPQIAAGFEEAKAARRVIEWLYDKARLLDLDDATMRETLGKGESAELRGLLVAESASRGVRCRYLDSQLCFPEMGYPGASQPADLWCPVSHCDQEHDVVFPPGTKECPFCGELVELLTDEDAVAEWKTNAEAWSRYAKLYPAEAAEEEARSTAAHAAADRRHRSEYDVAVAAQKD
ncbi:MAG: hypothetical protein H0T89_00715 [Deltaproteobacteria bacterium]|nr:hypothetical protein [Deltaproteobacteria bacterium]